MEQGMDALFSQVHEDDYRKCSNISDTITNEMYIYHQNN